MKMVTKMILLRLMFLNLAYSQYLDDYDIFGKLFNRKFIQGNDDYMDYNLDCPCWDYNCRDQSNDYISNDDSGVEVVFVDPGQVDNVYNFIRNRINERSSTEKPFEARTEYSNKQAGVEYSAETTEVEPQSTTFDDVETTTQEPNEGNIWEEQDSIDEIQDEIPHESNPEEIATPSSLDNSNNNSFQEEFDPSVKTELEEIEEDYPMRDSEEDRLSVKKNKDETKNIVEEDPEDDNNSEPENVLSWMDPN